MRQFCGSCGAKHTVLAGHQLCAACGETDWSNPIPVAVCVQPVLSQQSRRGLLIAKRAIEPKRGTWAMVGGHIENGETIEQGAIRELREETGLSRLNHTPSITGSYANGKGHVLVAVEFPPIQMIHVEQMVLCEENEAVDVMWEPRELGFPIHTWIANRWFRDLDV